MARFDPTFEGPQQVVQKDFSANPLEQMAWWLGLGDRAAPQDFGPVGPPAPPQPGFGADILKALTLPFTAAGKGYEAGGIPGMFGGFVSGDVQATGDILGRTGEAISAPFEQFGQQYAAGQQAVEGAPAEIPQAPSVQGQDMSALINALGASGGAGPGFSYETPIPVGPDLPQFPTGTHEDLLAEFEAQAPNQMDDLLLNIAEALVTSDPGTPLIRSVVKGGTKGLLASGAKEKTYKRELAKFRAEIEQKEFDAGMDVYKANFKVNADIADALTPKFVGGRYLITPERKGDKISHQVKDMKKSTVSQKALAKTMDSTEQFKALAAMDPGLAEAALLDAMENPNLMKLTASGSDSKTIDTLSKSRAIALIKQANPQIIQQLQLQMMMTALGQVGAGMTTPGVNP